jgi:hypothetical protein
MGLNSHEQVGVRVVPRESSSFRLRALRSSFFSFGLEQPCLLWSREQKESCLRSAKIKPLPFNHSTEPVKRPGEDHPVSGVRAQGCER